MSIEKTMLSCEDKLQGAAENLMGVSKSFQQMKIMDLLEKELVGINDIATMGIKEAIANKSAGAGAIIAMLQSMIEDGYKGLSIQLSNEIKNF